MHVVRKNTAEKKKKAKSYKTQTPTASGRLSGRHSHSRGSHHRRSHASQSRMSRARASVHGTKRGTQTLRKSHGAARKTNATAATATTSKGLGF